MAGSVTFDILISSIPHRHESLCALLEALDAQLPSPGVGVRLYRDNLEATYGEKQAALLASSQADYVSYIDDDDLPAPDYVARICAALAEGPDYVGYPVRWTIDGEPQIRVEHSLRHRRWENAPGMLLRDISEKNPLRREYAHHGVWQGGYGAEQQWAAGVRSGGHVRTEVWIPEPMYYYQYSTTGNFGTVRHPMAELPDLPSYPWLTVL
jgi:hypothetical protein